MMELHLERQVKDGSTSGVCVHTVSKGCYLIATSVASLGRGRGGRLEGALETQTLCHVQALVPTTTLLVPVNVSWSLMEVLEDSDTASLMLPEVGGSSVKRGH